MKCKNCGAELIERYNKYYCEFCESSFPLGESTQVSKPDSQFVINGPVLTSYCGTDREIIIPEGVSTIGKNAFQNNLFVETVVFSSTVVKIENNAFDGCINLRKIANYDNVKFYGEEAFKSSGITELTIGSNVASIGKYCFARNNNLVTVHYFPGKNIINNHTFAYCQKLENVEMDRCYFFPSFKMQREVLNNPNNDRSTYSDAFVGTPFLQLKKQELLTSYKNGICPECGGKINKGLFHAKCEKCNIDYKN